MTTVTDVIYEARTLLGAGSERLDELATDVTSSDTQLTLSHSIAGVNTGARLELRPASGSEVVHVWTADEDSLEVTIRRGIEGSPVSASIGDLVAINPRVSDVELLVAVGAVVRDLPGNGLYALQTATLTYDVVSEAWDLSDLTDLVHPYAVVLDVADRPTTIYEWRRENDKLRPVGIDPAPYSATLLYRGTFSEVTSASQDLTNDLGLPDYGTDVVATGAAMRVAARLESVRNAPWAQQTARRAEDVPPSAGLRTRAGLEAEFQRLLGSARRRQMQLWPPRIEMR